MQEEWIELESKKFGPFWLNKNTGETILPHLAPLEEKASADLHQATNSLTVEGEMEGRRVSDSQKHHLKSKKKKVTTFSTNNSTLGEDTALKKTQFSMVYIVHFNP